MAKRNRSRNTRFEVRSYNEQERMTFVHQRCFQR